MRFPLLLTGLLFLSSTFGFAQSPRLTDANAIGWFVYVGDHRITQNWSVHTEYQWRRVGWPQGPQQNLARLGLVRTLTNRLQVSGGYTYFESFRYGKYPEVPGRAEPEHRTYQDVTLTDQFGRLGLEQRVRLEQRWLGTRDETGQGPVQEWQFQNRIRYQISAEFPLQGATIDDRELYLNAFDELFIGFGRNVGDNVFNQNRLSAGLGYCFTSDAKLELNYIYQIRQHAVPDPATNRSVVELNNGFRLNILYNLNFTKQ